MPIIGSEGAASSKGFGQFARASAPTYIEEVFSTYLYTGNGSTQTITNGIDLAGKGGAVFAKSRTNASGFPSWFDTNRGALKRLQSSSTLQEGTVANSLTAFNSDGFSVGSVLSASSENFVGWTFRKQPKFFDVVTYTGTGGIGNLVNHSLGVRPSLLIAKSTSTTENWAVVYIDPNAANPNKTRTATLNSTAAFRSTDNLAGFSASTFDPLYIGNASTNSGAANTNGVSYVAYLFASNAGGFGLTGTDNVVSCGIYTGNGSATGPTVTLGYEPQWLMVKNVSGTGNWNIIDSMRGMTVSGTDAFLEANTSDAEATADWVSPTATGFQITSTSSEVNTSSSTYVYIAIRRGPMKVPTTGTSVFAPAVKAAGLGSGTEITVGFPYDMYIAGSRTSAYNKALDSRLTQNYSNNTSSFGHLYTTSTSAESSGEAPLVYNSGKQNSVLSGAWLGTDSSFFNFFRRAPSFFDVVCYTGDGTVSRTIPHNLGVIPELAIAKCRSSGGVDTDAWMVASSAINYMTLNNTNASLIPSSSGLSGSTSSVFDPTGCRNSYNYYPNISARTYVVYLFASCPGVSKVGSYTGNGTTQAIACGFTGGARFVLIKRTDSTGSWYVWDSSRGIVAGNDPYLLLNSTAAEVTSTDYIDTASTGFEISSTAPAEINASGGSFIFLAIA